MSIEIHVVSGRRSIKEFIRLPYGIYRGDGENWDAWVPPLNLDVRHIFDRKHNPMYHHSEGEFWIAREEGRVVGRIAAFVDRNFIDFQKTKAGFFGFFECFKRSDVAEGLLGTAEEWLKAKGMERCIGPVNGSTNFQLGNQINSFDEMPVIEMPYAPPFYGPLIEGAGYTKAQDLYSYRMNVAKNDLSEKIRRVSKISAERNKVTVRLVNVKNWNAEISTVKEIWEDAWADNWGFTPWYGPEFRMMARNLKLVMIPELTYIAEIDGKAVGFCFPIPDVNFAFHKINGQLFPTGLFRLLAAKKKFTQFRVAAFGVLKKYQNKAIDGIMITHLFDDATRWRGGGVEIGEFSWILENNMPLRNLLEKWGCEHYRTHRVYERRLQES